MGARGGIDDRTAISSNNTIFTAVMEITVLLWSNEE